jgi:drug/metabolite transporter (DMT)-like permease
VKGWAVPIVLAGLAAATFGVADFLGGTAARRAPSVLVAALAQLVGMVGMLALAALLPGAALPAALGWGLAAGVAGGIGVPLLYRGLARGPMNVVAPLTGMVSSAVPVLVGVLLGEQPSAAAWFGIALAVLAGALVGASSGSAGELSDPARPGRRVAAGVTLALLAGLGFGGFYVLLARAAPAAGLWPVAAAKVVGTAVAGAVLLTGTMRSGGGSGLGRRGWWLAGGGGVLDAAANAVYLLAVQRGALSVVGAIMALYPASTVLLARLRHGERLAPVQRVGLALAVPALVLVGAG